MSRPQVPRLRLSVLLAPLVLAVAACGASPTTSAPSASEPTAMETPTGTPLAPVDSSSALPPAPTPLTSSQITNGELDVPAICTDGSQLAGGYYGQDLAPPLSPCPAAQPPWARWERFAWSRAPRLWGPPTAPPRSA